MHDRKFILAGSVKGLASVMCRSQGYDIDEVETSLHETARWLRLALNLPPRRLPARYAFRKRAWQQKMIGAPLSTASVPSPTGLSSLPSPHSFAVHGTFCDS